MASGRFLTNILILILVIFGVGQSPVCADGDDAQTLHLFYEDSDLSIETRTIRPVSVSAEELTIITADEIQMRNVHSLADLITSLPGIQASQAGGPGSSLIALAVQGIPASHILVTMDGVTLNDLNDAFPDLAMIPARIIERVEIIKGPASSGWGPSTGGVINVYTKGPDDNRPVGGTLSGSIGERLTTDTGGEISGTVKDFGYYLSGGLFRTNGFQANGSVHDAGLYSRLLWTPGSGNRISLTGGWWRSERGAGDETSFSRQFRDDGRQLMATLSASRELTEVSRISFLFRTLHRNLDDQERAAGGKLLIQNPAKEDTLGGSVTYAWHDDVHSLVTGFDYDHGDCDYATQATPVRNLDRFGLFGSDTITVGNFSVTPGFRVDRVSASGDYLSPNLGLVWRATVHTRLKASIARGYGLPQLAPDLSPGRIFTWQAGVETQEWDPVLLHLHGFFSLVDGVPTPSSGSLLNEQRRNRGVEAGLQTAEYFHTTLSATLVYTDSRNDATGSLVPGAPRLAADVSLAYEDGPLKGLIIGHYLQRNKQPGTSTNAAFLWDLNVSGTVMTQGTRRLELFLALHNVLNDSQQFTTQTSTSSILFSTAGRWLEGGVRALF